MCTFGFFVVKTNVGKVEKKRKAEAHQPVELNEAKCVAALSFIHKLSSQDVLLWTANAAVETTVDISHLCSDSTKLGLAITVKRWEA